MIKSNSNIDVVNNITPLKSKKLINKNYEVRKNYLFIYEPIKVEKWLAEMELDGYNLNNIDRRGYNFTFVKGEKRKVKYFTDFTEKIDREYFEYYMKFGWTPAYNSRMIGTKAVLWAKPYAEGDKEPDFPNDKKIFRRNALRTARLTSISCIVFTLLYINQMIMSFKYLDTSNYILWIFNMLMTVLLINCIRFAKGLVFYYFKFKNFDED